MQFIDSFPCRVRFSALATLLVVAVSVPALADDVILTNGNSFEDVVATVEGSDVRIRLPHGELSLPLSRVARIERHSSPLEEFLERKARLQAEEAAVAQDWLELALWAENKGLDHAAKESAVVAARLEPRLAELEGLMERLGYVYDREVHRWLTRAEHLRRQGWVFAGGQWLSPEEQETLRQRRLEELALLEARRERHREQLAEVALETAIEARVQAEVAREVARRPVPNYAVPAVVGSVFVPFFAPHHPRHGGGDPPPPEVQREQIDPPARTVLLERSFGGRLGGSAPGRIRARSSHSRP